MNEEITVQATVDPEILALESEVGEDPEVQQGADVEAIRLEQEGEQLRRSADEWGEIFVMVLGPAFSVLAPNWNIQTAEIKALADSYAPLLAKYFPDVSDVGPEIGAAFCTIAVIGPRLAIPRKVVANSEEEPEPEKKASKRAAKSKKALLSEDDR